MIVEQKNMPFFVGLLTFVFWGTLVVYWAQLKNISSFEIVSYRAISSTIFCSILVVFSGSAMQVLNAFKNKKLLFALSVSSALILSNWLLFIYAVTHNHIIEVSMGYYINPLLNVIAGAIIFKVKMNKAQLGAVLLVVIGVMILVFSYGSFPFVALSLAVSFCLYGIVRKITPIDALPGLLVEAFIMTIPAIFYLLFLTIDHKGAVFTAPRYELILLLLSGIITTLPLGGFAYAAKNLNLATVGLLQYLSPTVSFMIGVFIYNEVFTRSHLISFIFIWIALAIYSIDAIIRYEIGEHKNKKLNNIS